MTSFNQSECVISAYHRYTKNRFLILVSVQKITHLNDEGVACVLQLYQRTVAPHKSLTERSQKLFTQPR